MLENGTASWREAVADVEALGKAEFLQLPDTTLERRHVGVDLRRERVRDDARLFGNQLKVTDSPGRPGRDVDPGQPRDDGFELGVVRQTIAEGDTRILAGDTKLDSQELAFAGDRCPQLAG